MQTVRHSGQQLQMLAQLTLASLALDFDRVPVKLTTRELFEITPWVVAAGNEVAANSLCIALQRQIMAVLVEDFSPGVVTSAFSVNDEAVEVEDHERCIADDRLGCELKTGETFQTQEFRGLPGLEAEVREEDFVEDCVCQL